MSKLDTLKCGHNLIDWDGNGNCITCTRDKIADPLGDMFEAMGVTVVDHTPNSKGNESVRVKTTNIEGDELEQGITNVFITIDNYGTAEEARADIRKLIQSEISRREQLLLDELEALDDKESEFMGDSGLYLWSSHIADFINAKKGKK